MDTDTSRTVAVPVATVPDTSDTLVRWLRTFWTKLYRDRGFIRYLQDSRAHRCAQLYLDVLESLDLLDHSRAPAFHRERWYPIVIRKDMEDMSAANLVRIGGGLSMATEESPSDGFSAQPRIGLHASMSDSVAYRTADDLRKVVACIVDSIVEPSVVLRPGDDFEVVDRSIVIRRGCDPFAEGSGFPVFEVPETPDRPATLETVLWACDALVDRNYVADHVGYAIGLDLESSDENAEFVRRIWDATTDGLSMCHLRQILAALCRVPCIAEDKETVERVEEAQDAKYVITDRNVYTFAADAALVGRVRPGEELPRGFLPDSSVRIYPFVVDADRVEGYSGFTLQQFMEDVSSISIPSALISGGSSGGFYVTWDEKDVVYDGKDANGNPRLMFDLGIPEDGGREFWKSVWSRYEKAGKSMESCFDGVSGSDEPGSVWGRVVPIKFFLRNLVGANTLIVFIDTDKVPEDAPLYDPNFYNAFRRLVPSYVRLYVVEHGTAVTDEFGSGGEDGEDAVSASEYSDDEFDRYEEQADRAAGRWVKKCRSTEEDEYD